MKPMKLSVAGLHSFRERQEIDFTTLTEMGIFGIFGPTGSGKSTILDAITLALYGDVGRAGRNTQAILNHAEKRLEVMFEFAIGSAQKRKCYRVERVYKRGQGFSVEHQASRLIEVEAGMAGADDGLVVIADAKTQVNQAIRNILGLEQSDFTRAVVLPQGKFAEFLQLTGSERSAMIERLFGFERYGKSLLDKVNSRVRGVGENLRLTQAGQAELGDASEAAVKAAQVALEEAQVEQKQSLFARQEALRQLQDAERIYDLQREEKAVQVKLSELNGQAPEMAIRRRALDAATQAEKVWPLVSAWRIAVEALKQARTTAEAQAMAFSAAEQIFIHAAEQDEAQRTRRAELEPVMLKQQGRLQEALVLAADLKKQEANLLASEIAYHQALDQSQRLSRHCETATQAMDDLNANRRMAEENLAKYTVTPQTRQHVNKLRHALQGWEQAQQAEAHQYVQYQQREMKRLATQAHVQKVLAEYTELQSEQELLEAKRNLLETDVPLLQAEGILGIRAWLAEIRPLVEHVANAKESAGNAEQRLLDAEVQLQELTVEAENRRREAAHAEMIWCGLEESYKRRQALSEDELIQQLAARLQDGVPCLVCGSEHHPWPAMGKAEHSLFSGPTEDDECNPSSEVAMDDAALAEAEQNWRRSEVVMREAENRQAQMQTSVELLRAEAMRNGMTLEQAYQRLCQCWQANAEMHNLQRLMDGLEQEFSAFLRTPTHDEVMWTQLLLYCESQVLQIEEQWQAWVAKRNVLVETGAELQHRQQQTAQELALAQATEQAAEHEAATQRGVYEAACGEWKTVETLLVEAMASLHMPGVQGGKVTVELASTISARIVQLDADDEVAASAQLTLTDLNTQWMEAQTRLKDLEQDAQNALTNVRELAGRVGLLREDVVNRQEQLEKITGGVEVNQAIEQLSYALAELVDASVRTQAGRQKAATQVQEAEQLAMKAAAALETQQKIVNLADGQLIDALAKAGFATAQEALDARLEEEMCAELTGVLKQYDSDVSQWTSRCIEVTEQLAGRMVDDETFYARKQAVDDAETAYGIALEMSGSRQERLQDISRRQERWRELEKDRVRSERNLTRLTALQTALRGNSFVQYMAREQMERVARLASHRLADLTRGRYTLMLTDDGSFLMQDHHNGGALRPVSTLSGGETFLTSLALALALSAHIQLRGQHPLEFFFLDEGFGTLDSDLLDVVISSLEKLHLDHMSIGLISHVPELRQRLQRRLVVEPAAPAGRGTHVQIEFA